MAYARAIRLVAHESLTCVSWVPAQMGSLGKSSMSRRDLVILLPAWLGRGGAHASYMLAPRACSPEHGTSAVCSPQALKLESSGLSHED